MKKWSKTQRKVKNIRNHRLKTVLIGSTTLPTNKLRNGFKLAVNAFSQ